MPLLLQAEGEGWRLEIIGRLPELPPFIESVPQTEIQTAGSVSVDTLDPKTGEVRPTPPGQFICPLFFEAVPYDIHFEKSACVSLTLPAAAEARRIRTDSEHHLINFGNNVGFADIRVNTPNGTASIRLEVFSRKVDYRTDYVAMRSEVSEILRNLAMAVNAKTYGLAAPAYNQRSTLNEWFSLLESYFEDFMKLTNAVSKKPHTGLVTHGVKRDTERVRKVSRQTINRALRRNNAGPAIPEIGVALPRRIEEQVSAITFDTPENRYYKGLLTATYRNMRALSIADESGDEDADRDAEQKFFDSIRPKLEKMERRLEAAMRAPFLNTVGEASLIRPQSMVFHKHPVYSRIDKMARLLNGGLSFAGDIVPIGVKDTALLYEYWCFLKIVQLLCERFDLEEQSVVQVNRFKTTVTLAKGFSSAMRFIHRPTQKELYVVYNRLFDRLPTIAQKPDNVIQIASDQRFYIFDAKYRIQFDKTYAKQYGGPGPTTEDINTMHRYRDAIAIPHPKRPNEYARGVVIGAVVLFPHPNEDNYRSHKFCKSIQQVEIGGLPFLPGATALMAQKLNDLLAAEYKDDNELSISPETGSASAPGEAEET